MLRWDTSQQLASQSWCYYLGTQFFREWSPKSNWEKVYQGYKDSLSSLHFPTPSRTSAGSEPQFPLPAHSPLRLLFANPPPAMKCLLSASSLNSIHHINIGQSILLASGTWRSMGRPAQLSAPASPSHQVSQICFTAHLQNLGWVQETCVGPKEQLGLCC